MTTEHIEDSMQLERLLQPLYMAGAFVVDLTAVRDAVPDLVRRLKHLNRYHTSKGGERLRIVTDCSSVHKSLGGPAGVFQVYGTVEEALTTT